MHMDHMCDDIYEVPGTIEEIVANISKVMDNVAGVMVVNANGITVKSTLESTLSLQVQLHKNILS